MGSKNKVRGYQERIHPSTTGLVQEMSCRVEWHAEFVRKLEYEIRDGKVEFSIKKEIELWVKFVESRINKAASADINEYWHQLVHVKTMIFG